MLLVRYSHVIRMLLVCCSYATNALVCYSYALVLSFSLDLQGTIRVFSKIHSGQAVLVFTDRQLSSKTKECCIYLIVFFCP